VVVEPGLTPREAAARRDFTINALMYDPRRREVLDFFDGRGDLSRRLLRHTSPAFVEDPLRVLRGLQFAGRFNLTATAETIALCRQIKRSHAELAVERRREEWFKWAGKSVAPSAGLRYLAATEWVEHYPEIQALMGTPQDPDWHPEGDVFVHTCLCCDALAEMPEFQAGDAEAKVVYMLAVLAHDFAKPQTTQRALKDGRLRIVSPGHDRAGVGLAEQFLARIDAPAAIRLRVLPLVAYHLAHFQDLTDRSVRRLARNLAPETIEGLCLVITADAFGRPPKPREMPEAVVQLRAKAAQLRVQASPPKPLLLGRHLIEAGLAPGPGFGPILRAAFEAQLEGEFVDLPGALAWLERRLGQAKAAQRSE
jgi:tRNA nucleotidyltransferase (CCA-adding enzyme)